MNKKFALTLLSSPALFASLASMVVMTQPAQASQVINEGSLACTRSPHTQKHMFVCERRQNTNAASAQQVTGVQKEQMTVAQAPNQITELTFTDEESDAAIKLFGCDCPSCIDSLRQLRGATQMAV